MNQLASWPLTRDESIPRKRDSRRSSSRSSSSRAHRWSSSRSFHSLSSMRAAMRLPSVADASPILAACPLWSFWSSSGAIRPIRTSLDSTFSPFGPSVVLTTGTSRRVPKNPERCVRRSARSPHTVGERSSSRRRFLASSTRSATNSLKASRHLSMVQRPLASPSSASWVSCSCLRTCLRRASAMPVSMAPRAHATE